MVQVFKFPDCQGGGPLKNTSHVPELELVESLRLDSQSPLQSALMTDNSLLLL